MTTTAGTSVMGGLVGSRVKRKEDLRILTGRGRYVDDVNPRGLLHAVFLRSPVAHGTITSIDVDDARALEGVVDVITGAEMAEITNPCNYGAEVPGLVTPTYPVLAVDTVRHVGEPVVMVIAESRAIAEDAAQLIIVDYDQLPVVTSSTQALADGAPQLFDDVPGNVRYRNHTSSGDVEAAFAQADHVISETITQHRWAPVPMETRGGVATFEPASQMLTYEAACQTPHLLKFLVAAAINPPQHLMRVLGNDVGGGFGLKWSPYREDFALCAAARRVGGTVKWIEDRNENLTSAGHGRDETVSIEVAVRADGEILGMRGSVVLDQGAYPIMPPPLVFTGLMRTTLPAPYRVPAYEFDETVAVTNKAAYVSIRGPWAMETLVRERLMDLVARELGITQVAVRERNMITLAEQPYEMVTGYTLENVTVHETFKRAIELSDPEAVRLQLEAERAEGRIVGFGIASFIEPAPGTPAYWASVGFPFGPEPTRIKVEPDGHVTIYTPQMPHGQGHETTLAQLVGDELGVPFDDIRLVFGDTQATPFTMIGTGGSRAATMASGGIVMASQEIRAKLLDIAADMLEASPADLEINEAIISVKGSPEVQLPLSQLAMTCYMAPGALPEGTDTDLQASVVYDGEGGGFSQATHCCWIEIDPDTGQIDIRRFLSVEDCGKMINPAVVEGQVRGAITMGLGGMLYEQVVYDDEGQCLTGTFMDYLMPTAAEMPDYELDHLEFETDKLVGSRGVGEGGTVLAPAVLTNAVEDAIIAAGGQRVTKTPLTPTRILELLGTIPAE
jgi:carbon-monoxide dehydrogenase large subunit